MQLDQFRNSSANLPYRHDSFRDPHSYCGGEDWLTVLKENEIDRLDGKNEKVEYKSKDEIGQLVEQYNRTVEELERNTQLLLASERETTWRTMARQVAHEINNPLTPMKLTLQQLQRTKDINPEQFDSYFAKATQTLIEQINNLSRIAVLSLKLPVPKSNSLLLT